MINQAMCTDSLDNHLLFPMKCHLIGVHIKVAPKSQLSPSVTTHAIEFVNPFDAAHLLIILLQLSVVTSFFHV